MKKFKRKILLIILISMLLYLSVVLSLNMIFNDDNELRVNFILLYIIILFVFVFLLGEGIEYLMKPLFEVEKMMGDLSSNKGGFNRFLSNIRLFIKENKTVFEKIVNSSTKTFEMMQETGRAMNSQDAEGVQLMRELERMLAVTVQIKKETVKSAESMKRVEDSAYSSMRSVRDLVEGIFFQSKELSETEKVMTLVEESTEQIMLILGVMTSLSKQTNLLALNASIEASRAGELGRGFKVVANEVGVLSKKTQNSAVQIQGMLDDLRDNVDSTSLKMRKSTANMYKIVEKAEGIEGVLGEASQHIFSALSVSVVVEDLAKTQTILADEVAHRISNVRTHSNLVIDNTQLLIDELSEQVEQSRKQTEILQKFMV